MIKQTAQDKQRQFRRFMWARKICCWTHSLISTKLPQNIMILTKLIEIKANVVDQGATFSREHIQQVSKEMSGGLYQQITY